MSPALDGPFLQDGMVLNYVAGVWERGGGDERLPDLDPANEREIAVYAPSTPRDAAAALAAAAATQPDWAATSVYARAEVLRRVAGLIRERADALAATLTREEGKPLAEARGETIRTAELLEVYAGLAFGPLGDVLGGHRPGEQWTFTRQVPLGVVVAITPWNFPLLLPAAKLGAALMTGNAVVVKPAEPTPITLAALVALFEEAGLPPGVLNLVLGRGSELGPALLRAPAAAVTFTGGNAAGRVVAQAAVDNHLKCQLELGGNNPVLVLGDADLDLVERELVAGVLGSTGQKCTATRRVFVVDEAFDAVAERLRTAFAGARLGPGLDPATQVGPLVSAAARDDFERDVAEAADAQRFGTLPPQGYFAAPALLLDPDPSAPYVRRETFGPLVSLMRVRDYGEGIARCNDTEYGLAAAVFTRSIKSAIRFADDVEAGLVHVNSQTPGSEPNMPFGGMKASSSHSREMGRHGLEWYTQLKSIYVEG